MKKIITTSLSILFFTSFALADEFCRPCPFDCISINIDSSHCSGRGIKSGLCCVDLDGDGQNQLRAQGNTLANECPVGFNVRQYRCTKSERANGCMDSRSRSGKSCIKWGRPRGPECPRGFNYRANRCTAIEKARGCKDTKSRSGGSCIRF